MKLVNSRGDIATYSQPVFVIKEETEEVSDKETEEVNEIEFHVAQVADEDSLGVSNDDNNES